MLARNNWGQCNCGCNQNIMAGDEFEIVQGSFYRSGHENRAPFDDGGIEVVGTACLEPSMAPQVSQESLGWNHPLATTDAQQVDLFQDTATVGGI